jgi:hypothetical protein
MKILEAESSRFSISSEIAKTSPNRARTIVEKPGRPTSVDRIGEHVSGHTVIARHWLGVSAMKM